MRQKHIQSAPEKQAGGDIANAQALKAWGDLVLEAKRTGIHDIESVCPPITVENLRKRYVALKEQLVQVKEAKSWV